MRNVPSESRTPWKNISAEHNMDYKIKCNYFVFTGSKKNVLLPQTVAFTAPRSFINSLSAQQTPHFLIRRLSGLFGDLLRPAAGKFLTVVSMFQRRNKALCAASFSSGSTLTEASCPPVGDAFHRLHKQTQRFSISDHFPPPFIRRAAP